ncbi:unnamed protein product [Nesidiocoris tenuis]|uniref:Uncharacterized protein n=2 Tax=Nesidiocoris tenuis TaxID=355587 RepID=A0A6H5HN70_9HEMI|nr:HIG1 domain family member [Nesidiocoris tenuis]CAB0019337.1 unnamed protein product [Nesidiocoris tenuis]
MADPPQEQFDWIRIKQEIGSTEIQEEKAFDKFKRKAMENPLVPFGTLLTTAALSFGLYSMKTGQRRMSQMMMRARIVAQAFTITALCGGMLMQAMKKAEEEKLAEKKIGG